MEQNRAAGISGQDARKLQCSLISHILLRLQNVLNILIHSKWLKCHSNIVNESDHQHALVFRCQVYQLQGNDGFINANTADFRKYNPEPIFVDMSLHVYLGSVHMRCLIFEKTLHL